MDVLRRAGLLLTYRKVSGWTEQVSSPSEDADQSPVSLLQRNVTLYKASSRGGAHVLRNAMTTLDSPHACAQSCSHSSMEDWCMSLQLCWDVVWPNNKFILHCQRYAYHELLLSIYTFTLLRKSIVWIHSYSYFQSVIWYVNVYFDLPSILVSLSLPVDSFTWKQIVMNESVLSSHSQGRNSVSVNVCGFQTSGDHWLQKICNYLLKMTVQCIIMLVCPNID